MAGYESSEDLIDLTSNDGSTDSQTATIFIGDDRANPFVVDISLINAHCPVLRTVLHKTGDCVELPEEDPHTFTNYLTCLQGDLGETTMDNEDYHLRFAEVWILANKLGDLATANGLADAMRHVHTQTNSLPGHRTIGLAFEACTKFSPLRRLVVDFYVLEATAAVYEKLRQWDVPQEFWYAVASEMKGLVAEVAKGPAVWEDALGRALVGRPMCDYHLFEREGCASCGKGG